METEGSNSGYILEVELTRHYDGLDMLYEAKKGIQEDRSLLNSSVSQVSSSYFCVCEISAPFTNFELLHASGIVLGIEKNNAESDTTIDLEVFKPWEININANGTVDISRARVDWVAKM